MGATKTLQKTIIAKHAHTAQLIIRFQRKKMEQLTIAGMFFSMKSLSQIIIIIAKG